MKLSRLLFATGALLFAVTTVWAQAPIPYDPDIPVGIVSDPCKGLPSLPDLPPAIRAAMMEAQKKGTPPPPISAEMETTFRKYQVDMLALDFGGLCRYQAENAKLPPATDHRVVMIGDSITEGWSRADPKLFEDDVINRGISGQTTPQMLIRFRADVLDLKPRVVHLLMGTNDVAGNTGPTTLKRIEDAITSMVEQARAEKVGVLLGSVLPAKKYPWRFSIEPTDNIAKLNAWLKNHAKANGLVYVDYYSEMDDGAHGLKSEFTLDGVHPNAAGYAVMKKLFLEALDAEVRKESPGSTK